MCYECELCDVLPSPDQDVYMHEECADTVEEAQVQVDSADTGGGVVVGRIEVVKRRGRRGIQDITSGGKYSFALSEENIISSPIFKQIVHKTDSVSKFVGGITRTLEGQSEQNKNVIKILQCTPKRKVCQLPVSDESLPNITPIPCSLIGDLTGGSPAEKFKLCCLNGGSMNPDNG